MEILQRLWVAWQPIVDLADGTLVGHEALIRGPIGSALALPADLFAWGERTGRARQLEEACRQHVFAASQECWPSDKPRLFLNVDGQWPVLSDEWEHPVPDAIPLAIEVSEHRSALDNPALLAALVRWRQAGHLIVIDDYGTGYAAAATVLAVQPDILKLDRQLIAFIDEDVRKQSLVRALRTWTHDLGIRLVAEGIETEEELAALTDLGCDYGQGFLLGRPNALMVEGSPVDSQRRRARVAAAESLGVDPTLVLYAQSIAGSPIASYVVDRRRRMVAWNEAAASLLGYEPVELVNQRCFQSPLDHRNQEGQRLCTAVCPLVHSMAMKRAHAAVTSIQRADGQRQLVQVWVTPLFGAPEGRVVGALEQFEPVAHWPSAFNRPGNEIRLEARVGV
ncbi:MAG: EAL domain-containing protein [Thermaerobacter sp.]|nr:EAL domain-containing protein [Thermaerobacter sp.]